MADIDDVTLLRALDYAGIGGALAATDGETLHPGQSFGSVLLWALNFEQEGDSKWLEALLQSYGTTLRRVKPGATFEDALIGLKAVIGVTKELTLEEERAISDAIERFGGFDS